MRIGREFFMRDPVVCASELVGCELSWNGCSGIVVETEAYSVRNDEACHTFSRKSARAFVAEHRAGSAYVYLNYGMYWLFNVLVSGGSEDGFVLLRAVEPKEGIPLMQSRRCTEKLRALCSGPGKLAQAFGISGSDHGRDLCGDERIGFLHRDRGEVVADVRVGITKALELPWRFLLADSPFVSVRKKGPDRRTGLAPQRV